MALALHLESRLGRRIAALFVVGALVPILGFGVFGYFQVRSQLLAQAQEQLALSAKSVGMGIFDQLRIATALLEGADTARLAEIASAVARGNGAVPDSVALLRVTEGPGGTAVLWLSARDGSGSAHLRTDYLFQGARDRAAVGTAETDVCVTDTRSGSRLYCERAATDDARITATWDLFLGYDYGVPPWRVEVGLTRSAVLAPVRAFRQTLAATLVLVIGLVVALTSIQVRRSLEPLRALRDGTRRLAAHDFSRPVSVSSRDEFEELADSFNSMSNELDLQFQDNARLIARLNDLSWGALAALARTVDASSPWTAGHSERVTSLSLRMAERLGMSRTECDALHRGGLLHDIGKIGISPEILDKPGMLLPAELARMREHPLLGAKILQPLAAFADAVPVVMYHHERYDGHGYPAALMGERIPRLARLLAVADVYDALVSDRPYRPGWSHDAAMAHIDGASGSQFDPVMVAVFQQVMAAEGDAARFTLPQQVPA